MIDLGLSKIAIIAVVALIVLGPERLPKVARIAGTLLGRAQRYMNAVKEEVSREMQATEIDELKALAQSVNQDIISAETQVRQGWANTHAQLQNAYQQSAPNQPLNKTTDVSDYQNALAIARARRTGRASWAVKRGKTPAWFKAQQRQQKKVLSEAARMSRHRPHQTSQRPRGFL